MGDGSRFDNSNAMTTSNCGSQAQAGGWPIALDRWIPWLKHGTVVDRGRPVMFGSVLTCIGHVAGCCTEPGPLPEEC